MGRMKSGGRIFAKLFTRSRSRIAAALAAGAFAGGAVVLFAAPVIGDEVGRAPQPAGPASAGVMETVPATVAQVAGASIPAVSPGEPGLPESRGSKRATTSKKVVKVIRKKVVMRRVTLQSRITTNAITTEENEGTFVGVRCPAGSKAVSGGVLSSYINLIVSSSAPNHPVSGKYTPRKWWVSVSNVNLSGDGKPLSWRGVVNCLSPVKLPKK